MTIWTDYPGADLVVRTAERRSVGRADCSVGDDEPSF